MNISNKNSLTIILQIRDRFELSSRWLDFAYQKKCPYDIYVADGSSNTDVKKYLNKEKLFRRLKIKYVKSKYDKTWKIYCNKIQLALNNINTPYILLADDDDFYLFENIQKCIDRLDENKKLVSCGGQTVNFQILDGDVYGKKIEFIKKSQNSYMSESILQNIKLYFKNSPGIYYNIHRIDYFKEAWGLSNNQNFKNARMTELFIEMYLLTFGKNEFLSFPYYYRQFGKSVGNSSGHSHDFLDEMFKFNWYKDINNLFDIISTKISKNEEIEFPEVKAQLFRGYKFFLRPWIINGINITGNSKGAIKSRKLMFKNALRSGNLKNCYQKISNVFTYFKILFNKKGNNLIISNFLKK